MGSKRKRTHTAVTMDPESYAEIERIAAIFSRRLGTTISRTDVVRMGITALLTHYPAAQKEPRNARQGDMGNEPSGGGAQ